MPGTPDTGERVHRRGVGTRSSLLRELNEQALLETIFREGPVTRPELAARTGLSESAVKVTVHRAIKSLGEDVNPGGGDADR